MKEIRPTPLDNVLKEIHLKLTAFPNLFRDKVTAECSWSTPTYYRKMKAETPASLLSNAEKEKIVALLEEHITELQIYYQRFKRG